MDRKRQRIEERLEAIEKRLRNAQEYVARNVNVEGSSFLHFDDWDGRSGHPLWMKNWMIPCMMKNRARTERLLENIDVKTKDKNLARRKQQGRVHGSETLVPR